MLIREYAIFRFLSIGKRFNFTLFKKDTTFQYRLVYFSLKVSYKCTSYEELVKRKFEDAAFLYQSKKIIPQEVLSIRK